MRAVIDGFFLPKREAGPLTGKVKFINQTKEFGFITPDEKGEREPAFKFSDFPDVDFKKVKEGQSVVYRVHTSKDGTIKVVEFGTIH